MKVSGFFKALLFVFAVSLFVNNMPLQAQQKTSDKKEEKAEPEKKIERKNTKILLDKIEITGKIEKPQAAFIIQGQETSIEDIHIDRSFFREMFRKIEREDMKKMSERRRAKSKKRK